MSEYWSLLFINMVDESTGVTRDYLNDAVPVAMTYQNKGIDSAIQLLRERPLSTYEERRAIVMEKGKDNPDYCARIEEEYALTEQNADLVRRINNNVGLINRAVREDRLTHQMFYRLYGNLWKLVTGEEWSGLPQKRPKE